jgi:hypothetical protein
MPKLKNKKHEKFCQEVIKEKGNRVDAYAKVYPNATRLSAKDRAYRLMKENPDIQGRLSELLEVQGLGLVDLNEKLRKLTKAEKAIVVGGKVEYVRDDSIRLNALQTAYKLHKVIGSEGTTNIDNRSINLSINPEQALVLEKIAKKFEKMTEALKNDTGQSGEVVEAEVIEGS